MRTLVVFHSVYGNTEAIARAIGRGVGGEVSVAAVAEAGTAALASLDLLLVGSPTQGARQTVPVQAFLDKIPAGGLKNVSVAAFDTRISAKSGKFGTRLIAALAGGFGYAAGRIAAILKEKGGHQVAAPEGFIVDGIHGPLKDGETERAAAWAKGIAGKVKG